MTTSMVQNLLLGAGIVMAVIAVGFGGSTKSYGGDPTYSQAGAALGFAIASGLCFLALSIVHREKPAARPSVSVDEASREDKPSN